ncbi:C40 family peptidase [Candidatus Dependentiae bacterium]|nr:C40 family peptidase [Candidatus Dependentiae bacterium]
MKLSHSLSLIILLAEYHIPISSYSQKMIISVPVANLRNAPQDIDSNVKLPTSENTNPLQGSQLLLGEYIVADKEYINQDKEKWLRINALQQPRFDQKKGWHGFPGWLKADHAIPVTHFPVYNLIVNRLHAPLFYRNGKQLCILSIGTKLQGLKLKNNLWKIILPDNKTAFIKDQDVYQYDHEIKESLAELRNNIIAAARSFLGSFYSWGGRSAQHDHFGLSSVDCSSFVHLVFLANGLQIPRNAHDQFLTTKKIDVGKDLMAGDLVFFDPIRSSTQKPPIRMSHVLLYIGNNQLIESTNSGDRKVRIISFEERIGKPLTTIKSGDRSKNITTRGKIAGQYHIFFGSYLQDPAIIKKLRNQLLHNHED